MAAIAGARFLITGGASLIGSHIADALLAQGAAEVRLFDDFSLGTPDVTRHLEGEQRVRLVRGDVLRLHELIDAMQDVTGVFALAAFLTLPLSRNVPLGVAVSTQGVVNTLEAARIAHADRVVFSSSIAAYGASSPATLGEDTPFTSAGQQPATNLYGTSKLMGEALCAHYAQAHKLEYNALRFSSVYGERQHARAVNAVFIAESYDRIARGERPVIVGDGSEVHDYIYVTDVAAACVAAMASQSHGNVLNIATGVDTTPTRVVELLLAACGSGLAPEYRADTRTVKSASLAHLRLDRSRAEHSIGWRPQVSVEDGIRRYVAWRRAPMGAGAGPEPPRGR
jgi:UDP-glucose 4-epimerase